jgi:hypothetical protein
MAKNGDERNLVKIGYGSRWKPTAETNQTILLNPEVPRWCLRRRTS